MTDSTEDLNQEQDVTLDTEYTPLPENEDPGYTGTLVGIRVTIGEKDGKVWKRLDGAVQIEPSEIPADSGLQTARVALNGFFLDVDPATGSLTSGTNRNVRLGKLLVAAGIEGKWKFADLEGRGVRVAVYHKADDEGTPRARIRWFRPV